MRRRRHLGLRRGLRAEHLGDREVGGVGHLDRALAAPDYVDRDIGPVAEDHAAVVRRDEGRVLRYLPDVPVRVVQGSERAIKVTYPADLAIAEAILRAASPA